MTTTVTHLEGGAASPSPRGRPRRARRPTSWLGLGFSSIYLVLLLGFGVGPTLYALYLSFTNAKGQFTGLGQFVKVAQDYRFASSFLHIGLYLVFWLVSLVILTVGLALLVHRRRRGASMALRFLYYLPGALAGVAGVLIWVFMLDPTTSPFGGILRVVGIDSVQRVATTDNAALIIAVMALWTGAGGWILVMYGALNNISVEVMDAAKIDGAGAWTTAWRIQIPMIRKWIAYMVVLAFGAGTQLFVEPFVLTKIGSVPSEWAPNQLAFWYAFTQSDFNGAAAVSMYILVLGVAGALLVVFRSGLFNTDAED